MSADDPKGTDEDKPTIGPSLWIAGIAMLLLGILLGIVSATKALVP